ncbi:MAG: response regulator [Armatimonadetes bacterium]|nr:response regulator [Anaerolineae bacterium]
MMRILYVEDNPANLFLVKRVAKIGGHEVINYIDGEDALTNFDKDHPDLVLMDIQLAGDLTGLQVVQKLRAKGHQTPIIAVTAYAMIGDRERFLAAGCDDYLAKPLPIPRLVELLEQYNHGAVPTETELDKRPTRQMPRSEVVEPSPMDNAPTRPLPSLDRVILKPLIMMDSELPTPVESSAPVIAAEPLAQTPSEVAVVTVPLIVTEAQPTTSTSLTEPALDDASALQLEPLPDADDQQDTHPMPHIAAPPTDVAL